MILKGLFHNWITRYAILIALWGLTNVVVLLGFHFYELRQLSQQFHVPVSVLRQHESRTLQIATGDPDNAASLPFRYRPPRTWTGEHNTPLVIFLHGSGDRGYDNVQQLRPAPSVMCEPSLLEEYPCAVLAPQCPQGLNWSSPVDGTTDMQDVIIKMIDEALKDTQIDPQRVYLTGFSMGGFGAWDLAASFPDRFAAVVPIAGGGNPELAQQFVDVPVWAVHGADDDVVLPSQSSMMIEAIKAAGGHPRYSELAGVGHTSWDQVFCEDSEVLDWMFQQKRTIPASTDSE